MAVIEICRDRNNCLRYFFTQVTFSSLLHFSQHHGADILRCILLSVNVNLVRGTHFTFNGNNGPVGIRNGLALCYLADKSFSVFGESYNRRSCTAAFRVCDDDRLSAFHNGDAAVGCTQVNTDNLAHNLIPPFI